jgi:hypothetical protein
VLAFGLVLVSAAKGREARPGPPGAFPSGQFALDCSGRRSIFREYWDGRSPERFDSVFHTVVQVDADHRRFCTEQLCGELAPARPDVLKYECRSERTHTVCPPVSLSTGGAIIRTDDLTIDLKTGAMRRVATGAQGDPGARPYRAEYAGSCVRAPFGGLHPPADLPQG